MILVQYMASYISIAANSTYMVPSYLVQIATDSIVWYASGV